MDQKKTKTLVEASVMLALSVALSFIVLWTMPMGGSITLCSMLPLFIISLRHGCKWGLATSFIFSLFQIAFALVRGNVFVYCTTADMVIICALFDYIIPYTLLGTLGSFPKSRVGVYGGMCTLVTVRFFCHFISGVLIWKQWAEGLSPWLYSLLYNGSFLLPELLLCITVAVFLFEVPGVRRLVGLRFSSKASKA